MRPEIVEFTAFCPDCGRRWTVKASCFAGECEILDEVRALTCECGAEAKLDGE